MCAQLRPGRHELGQNFLVDHRVIGRVTELVRDRPGPILEWGTGSGAITEYLADLGRPVEGIEVDGRRAEQLGRRLGPHVCIRQGDILRHAPPAGSIVVSNVPFHLTTPILRHLLSAPGWRSAVLILQWEVARKRAGIGGATQLTAQSWPWFEFSLDQRIPASAFRPRPSVDAGLLVIDRRQQGLLDPAERSRYQRWVVSVFGSRGRGLYDVLVRRGVPRDVSTRIVSELSRGRRAPLPRDLRPEDWAIAFASARDTQQSQNRAPRKARRR
ncbi:ribosomal RNA small subunit methyltransferase A [Flexivirga oryzae]|uniref:23S rRNA (Adenine-N6)-dimethyltransferase n=1 Tax=Flexivirga oryzae TaxID=1794944 RepID=A0A839NI40_9MICO|nr:rRNA adenine N(6)-methyltransferase family protein [Flexivirga oryzae]MBB2894072.1 23S rRNA (adenine-N6)-dimethyltransferase [Flexivirga oryzae]